MKKGQGFTQLAIVIITVIVAILGITGFAAYKYFTPKQQASTETLPTPVVATNSPTPIPDETADWKTYRDDKYGFEIQYPANWRPGSVNILSVYDDMTFCPKTDPPCETSGIYMLMYLDRQDLKQENYYLGKNRSPEIYYYISNQNPRDKDIFEKMISTFKFTK